MSIDNENNNIECESKEITVDNTNNIQAMYEDSEGNYRYRGFWSGFGDQ